MHYHVLLGDALQFVALAVEFLPEDVFQFGETHICHRRDEHHGKVVGQCLAQHLDKFVVEQVTFCDGKNPVLVEHVGIEVSEFVEQYLVFFLDVVGITRHHKKQ